jgi:hypothetical protein
MINSNIAQLLSQIEAEQRAAQWALTGISSGSLRHRFISRRMNQIGVCNEQLTTIMGDREQAIRLVLKRIDAL